MKAAVSTAAFLSRNKLYYEPVGGGVGTVGTELSFFKVFLSDCEVFSFLSCFMTRANAKRSSPPLQSPELTALHLNWTS
jgi:hypothetical protein